MAVVPGVPVFAFTSVPSSVGIYHHTSTFILTGSKLHAGLLIRTCSTWEHVKPLNHYLTGTEVYIVSIDGELTDAT